MSKSRIHLAMKNGCMDDDGMNTASIAGIVMIVGGAALLMFGGFTTTERENILNVGPLKVEADVEKSHKVPPVVSWALLGGGVAVLVFGLKKSD